MVQRSHGLWLAAAVAAVGLVQIPFIFLPGPFWDGWIYHLLFLRGDRTAFLDPFLSNGRPLGGWTLWWAMSWMGVTLGPKLTGALMFIASAAFLYGSLRVRNILSPHHACLVSVIATTVPATQTVLSSSALQFFLGFGAFYAGLYLITRSAVACGRARVLLYLGSLVCAGLSVMLAEAPLALLPLYPVGWLLGTYGANVLALPVRRLILGVLGHSAAIWVGLACLIATFLIFPTTGGYEGAHTLQLQPMEILKTTALFTVALVGCELPLIIAVAWIIKRHGPPDWTRTRPQLLAALAVLSLALAPYIASGRWPAILGWGTRTLMFSGLGIGLLVHALSYHATSRLNGRRLVATMLLLCSAALACTLWRLPLWAARQVRDDGMQASLAALPQARLPSVIWISDPNWVIASPYRDYEWTAQVQLATGRNNILAMDRSEDGANGLELSARRMREEHRLLLPGQGTACQADLQIGKLPASWPLYATMALAVRALTTPERYQQWLQGKVPVDLQLRGGCSLSPDKP